MQKLLATTSTALTLVSALTLIILAADFEPLLVTIKGEYVHASAVHSYSYHKIAPNEAYTHELHWETNVNCNTQESSPIPNNPCYTTATVVYLALGLGLITGMFTSVLSKHTISPLVLNAVMALHTITAAMAITGWVYIHRFHDALNNAHPCTGCASETTREPGYIIISIAFTMVFVSFAALLLAPLAQTAAGTASLSKGTFARL